MVLIDTCSTHNLVDLRALLDTPVVSLIVTVAHGDRTLSRLEYSKFKCEMQGYKFILDVPVTQSKRI